MGVRGLNLLFDLNPQLSKPYQLHDTRVVFDGHNLAYFLYFSYEVPCSYGGDYDRYGAVVKEYFSSFLQCRIEPVVILDGGQDKIDRKLQRIIERTNTRLELVDRIVNQASYSEKLLPVFAYNVFIDVIKEMNIAHAQSAYESDASITSIANHYQCPVISLDSDFYIFDIYSGFIRSDHVDTTVRTERTDTGNSYRYLNCRLYTIDYFLSFFPGVHKKLLPLFGTLLGNDFVDASAFENFFLSDEFPDVIFKKLKLKMRHKRIVGLLEWLKKYRTVDDVIEDVISYVPKEQSGPLRKRIKQAVDAYEVFKPYLIQYIDPLSAASKLSAASPEETLMTSDGRSLPVWFIQNFHKVNMSSYVMNVVGLRRIILPTQMENLALPSSHICSLTIRQVLYGLLISLDGVPRDSACSVYVEEFDRLGNQLQKKFVKPIMVLEGFGDLPDLSKRQMNEKEGKRLVSYALRGQNTDLNDLPDSLQLLVISIQYWLGKCSPKPTACFFDAVLLTVLYLRFAEPESSGRRNTTTDDFRKFSDGQYGTSVLDIMGNVLPENATYFWKKFQRYCRPPSHDGQHPVDVSIIHSYSQLQGCLFYSLLINEVTGQPFSTPKLQTTFSGSLIYNATLEMQAQSSPKSFIAEMLGPCSALECLFSKLKIRILENLPTDCFRESGLRMTTENAN